MNSLSLRLHCSLFTKEEDLPKDKKGIRRKIKNKSSSIDIFYCSLLSGGLKQAAFHSNVASIIGEIMPFKSKWTIEWSTLGNFQKFQTAVSGVL